MEKMGRIASFLHKAVLAYLGVFTVPALLTFLLSGLGPTAAGVLETLAPVLGWLMSLWFFAALYLCGCLVFSAGFRETLLTRISGFKERDEREEIVTAKAARSVFLVTLGCLITAGLAGMIQINMFAYTRWQGDHVPPLQKVGPYELRRGEVAKRDFIMWPSIGIPRKLSDPRNMTELERGGTQYYFEHDTPFGPETSGTFFALAAVQVLLFHLFARRVRV